MMNERIKELAGKANIHFSRIGILDGDPDGSARLVGYSKIQKFAELIVEECEAKHFSEGYLCGKKDGRFLAIHECSEYLRERGDISRAIDLREHFGVE